MEIEILKTLQTKLTKEHKILASKITDLVIKSRYSYYLYWQCGENCFLPFHEKVAIGEFQTEYDGAWKSDSLWIPGLLTIPFTKEIDERQLQSLIKQKIDFKDLTIKIVELINKQLKTKG